MILTTKEEITISQNYERETVIEINLNKEDYTELVKSILKDVGINPFISAFDVDELAIIAQYYYLIKDPK